MKEMVQLGENLFYTQRLQKPAMQRTVEALRKFMKLVGRYDVDETLAVGTSALREANNADEFVKRVKREFGLKIRIISGQEEARLIMKAILAFEPLAGDRC